MIRKNVDINVRLSEISLKLEKTDLKIKFRRLLNQGFISQWGNEAYNEVIETVFKMILNMKISLKENQILIENTFEE